RLLKKLHFGFWHKTLSISALLDQFPPTTYQFRPSVTAPIPRPVSAARRLHLNCACRDGNSKSPAHPHRAIASSRESFASEPVWPLLYGRSDAPRVLARQSRLASRLHRASSSARLAQFQVQSLFQFNTGIQLFSDTAEFRRALLEKGMYAFQAILGSKTFHLMFYFTFQL